MVIDRIRFDMKTILSLLILSLVGLGTSPLSFADTRWFVDGNTWCVQQRSKTICLPGAARATDVSKFAATFEQLGDSGEPLVSVIAVFDPSGSFDEITVTDDRVSLVMESQIESVVVKEYRVADATYFQVEYSDDVLLQVFSLDLESSRRLTEQLVDLLNSK